MAVRSKAIGANLQRQGEARKVSPIPIIDAHQHFWDLGANYHPWLSDEPMIPFRYGDYSALKRNYLPADYRKDVAGFDVAGTVYVEAEWDPADPIGETRWVNELAGAAGLPTAIVAQAWLDREDAAEVLAAQAAFPLVRGIRQKPAATPSPESARRGAPASMDDPRFRGGFARLQPLGLSYDLQTPWWHLNAALELARDFPETQIILNHTGLPADRSEEGIKSWRKAMAALADAPNVALKISGLGQPGQPWTVEANGPVVRDAIAMFGTDRCMFASNFPVDGLCAAFRTIFSGFMTITAGMSEDDRKKLFHDNAKQIYRL
jgi:predicted TIM-barrel fold metal-dependent hydrolase